MKVPRFLVPVLFVTLCLTWGTTWLAIKIGLRDSPPILGAALRFLLAGALVFIFLKIRGRPLRPARVKLVSLTGLSLCLFTIPYFCVYWGEQYISSGLAAVLFASYALYVAVIAHRLLDNERLSVMGVAGLFLGILGLTIVFREGISISEGSRGVLGMAAVLIGAVFSALGSVWVRRDFRHVDPLPFTGAQMLIASVPLLAMGLLTESLTSFHITRASVGALLYLALAGSVYSFAVYFWLVQRVAVTRLSLIVFITPLVALYVGWRFGQEPVDLGTLLGTLMVLGGIHLARVGHRS